MAITISDDEFGLGSSDEAELLNMKCAPLDEIAINDSDDEYGLSSSDDVELLNLAAIADGFGGTKRKYGPAGQYPEAKRMAIESCSTHSSIALNMLRDNFGLKDFRLKQSQVIARLLDGGSAVVVFPTGGGKSLCYQVPALAFSVIDKTLHQRGPAEDGITLVVSPLLALMKDQVDALGQLGIKAATLDSTKSRDEYLKTCDMLRNGELKLLYCAPERLNNEGFVEQMKSVRGGIRMVAIDEAHCVSEWGHAFRPDYLKVSRFVKEIKAERVICLTATATHRVAIDICKAFDVDYPDGLFRTSTYRPNLNLLVESATTKQNLYHRLFTFLRSHPGPTVIYVTLQKQTEALAEDLRDQGFEARSFHAGMQTLAKTELQEEFMKSSKLIIVATIAFGMGIDKADIRNVVHFNIPNSLESYSQEIGRGGRDGKISNCIFYVSGEDLHLREVFSRGDLPSEDSVRLLIKEIFNSTTAKLPPGETLIVSHWEQEIKYDMRPATLSSIYAQLELRFQLLRATTPIYAKYSYTSLNDSFIERDNSPPAKAIKAIASRATKMYTIDVDKAANYSPHLLRTDIIRKLNEWKDSGIIELKTSGVMNVYRILKNLPNTAHESEAIVKDLYALMQTREQQALDCTEEVLALITKRSCFSRSLAQHFGDELPDGKTECGHCTFCLTHVPTTVRRLPPVTLDMRAFKAVLAAVPARDDARFLARVAFGIRSPRVTKMKLAGHWVFESMSNHGFMDLLHAFQTECDKANRSRQ